MDVNRVAKEIFVKSWDSKTDDDWLLAQNPTADEIMQIVKLWNSAELAEHLEKLSGAVIFSKRAVVRCLLRYGPHLLYTEPRKLTPEMKQYARDGFKKYSSQVNTTEMLWRLIWRLASTETPEDAVSLLDVFDLSKARLNRIDEMLENPSAKQCSEKVRSFLRSWEERKLSEEVA